MNYSFNESRANSASPVLWCNENTGEPWRKLLSCLHVILHETGGAQDLSFGQRDKCSWNFTVPTVAFDSPNTIFHSLVRTEMAPFSVMPASDNVHELRTISQVFDGHARSTRTNQSTYFWAIGIRRPSPKARLVTFNPGAACSRLYSLRSTRRCTHLTVFSSNPRPMMSRALKLSST